MGKEWLYYWGGGNGGKSTKKAKSRGRKGRRDEREAVTTHGCMFAIFQLFDLHQFQFAFHHQTSLKTDDQDEPSTVLKGVEAPRNSLEIEEICVKAATSFSSVIKDEEILTMPVGIQIKTSCENRSPRASTSSSSKLMGKFGEHQDLFSECSSSSPGGGSKTPNLVARLMGLDLLPESPSPSFSSSRLSTSISHCPLRTQNENRGGGSVSLPETPRISSASSRRSDAVAEHRLSLQITNKENNIIGEVLELSKSNQKKMGRRRSDVKMEDENRSPSHYAKTIAKQIKERVISRRRVGLDITNTIKNSSDHQIRRDEHLVLLKPKKPSPDSETTVPSCSPRVLSSLSLENQSRKIVVQQQQEESNVLAAKINKKSQLLGAEVQQKCKKSIRNETDGIRNKREEPFVRSTTTNKASNISDKKCKRSTPLSNQLILPVRKDSSLPLTKLRHKQRQEASDALWWGRSTTLQLSSCAGRGSSYSYSQQQQLMTYSTRHHLTSPGEKNIQVEKYNGTGTSSTTTSVSFGNEIPFQYIKRILKRIGIDNSTPVSLAKWFSHSHPLDPSTFHYIELFHPTAAGQRSNRKLIFQLVNELLVETLKPVINPKPWINKTTSAMTCRIMYGSELIEELCRKIKNFPLANCQVLEDIDVLIGKDLRNCEMGRSLEEAYEEVGEKIALEIERDIIETLMHETISKSLAEHK